MKYLFTNQTSFFLWDQFSKKYAYKETLQILDIFLNILQLVFDFSAYSVVAWYVLSWGMSNMSRITALSGSANNLQTWLNLQLLASTSVIAQYCLCIFLQCKISWQTAKATGRCVLIFSGTVQGQEWLAETLDESFDFLNGKHLFIASLLALNY